MSRHIACVNCHGVDGKGGLLFPDGITKSADIRWSSLAKEGFEQATFNKAVTKGLDESDQPLSTWMPRWTISDTDLNDLTVYLKTL
jgi:cytochrome c oxidase subunit II